MNNLATAFKQNWIQMKISKFVLAAQNPVTLN